MTSLYIGVSGMRNYLLGMDVVSNNLANVNTFGFKKGRAAFREALQVWLGAATMPTDRIGGTNPKQLGLGVELASVDNIFTQGEVIRTGVPTDLAIEGDGFFIVRNGVAWYYTRDGSFSIDADGKLVDSNGCVLQGRMAEPDGTLPTGGKIEDIVIPAKLKVPAKATTEVKLACNLDMREDPLPDIYDSQCLLARPDQTEDMDGLYAAGYLDNFLHLNAGDTITIDDGLGNSVTYTYTVDFTSLQDLVNAINNDFGAAGFNTLQASLTASPSGAPNIVTGEITFSDLTGSAHDITITSSNGQLATAFQSANGTIDSSTGATTQTDTFSHIAKATDWLVDLRDNTGQDLQISAGDSFQVTAELGVTGGPIVPPLTIDVVTAPPAAGTNDAQTYQDLANLLEDILSDGDLDGYGSESTFKLGDVTIDSTDGSLRVEGDPGTDNSIEKLQVRIPSLSATGESFAFSFIKEQDAQDVLHAASIKVYDSQGDAHTLIVHFKKDNYVKNKWHWWAEIEDCTIWQGGSGLILFNPDGSLAGFSYDNGANAIVFDPGPGRDSPQTIQLWVGDLNQYNGVTQLAEPMTTIFIDQDGYPAGSLQDIVVDDQGTIWGQFTNGYMSALAKIVVARFNNPQGLKKIGRNLFAETANSGDPMVGDPGTSVPGTKIIAQALEESNVDLAEEFVYMIMMQRGFEANARVIQTTDRMLQEATRLKMM